MSIFEERGKPVNPERNLLEQRRETVTNSTHIYDAGSRNRTPDTLVGGERSHHCAIPAPKSLQIQSSLKVSQVLSENVPNSKDFSDVFTGTSQDVFTPPKQIFVI